MRDPNLVLTVSATLLVFAAIAIYLPRYTAFLARKTRSRAPHAGLLLVARVWFALLALGCLSLLLFPLFHHV